MAFHIIDQESRNGREMEHRGDIQRGNLPSFPTYKVWRVTGPGQKCGTQNQWWVNDQATATLPLMVARFHYGKFSLNWSAWNLECFRFGILKNSEILACMKWDVLMTECKPECKIPSCFIRTLPAAGLTVTLTHEAKFVLSQRSSQCQTFRFFRLGIIHEFCNFFFNVT